MNVTKRKKRKYYLKLHISVCVRARARARACVCVCVCVCFDLNIKYSTFFYCSLETGIVSRSTLVSTLGFKILNVERSVRA